MSKKVKKASKAKNMARKRAIRLANKNTYQGWAREGDNSKSKRARAKNKKTRLIKTTLHKNSYKTNPCGNIGCRFCNPKGH